MKKRGGKKDMPGDDGLLNKLKKVLPEAKGIPDGVIPETLITTITGTTDVIFEKGPEAFAEYCADACRVAALRGAQAFLKKWG